MKTKKLTPQKIEIINQDEDTKAGYVTLPYNENQFKDFIVGLLGQPQTIEGDLNGTFNYDKGHIININHLIEQRIEQNDSHLISINLVIYYDDNSSITLNSIEAFRTYNEVRPIVPLAIHISWIFLIKFKSKDVPEKQVINLSIKAGEIDESERMVKYRILQNNSVSYNIQTTDRTWGIDIENLLRNHFNSSFQKPKKFISLINHIPVEGILITFFVIMSLVSSFFASNLLKNRMIASYQNIISNESNDISKKIDWLSNSFASGMWANFFLAALIFIVASIIIAVFLASKLESISFSMPQSYLLFNDASKERKRTDDVKLNKLWKKLISSFILGILGSLIANVIYALYFQRLF